MGCFKVVSGSLFGTRPASHSVSWQKKLFLPTHQSTPLSPSHIFPRDEHHYSGNIYYDDSVADNTLLRNEYRRIVYQGIRFNSRPFQSPRPELTGRGIFLEVESDYMSTSGIRGCIQASWREMIITNPPITTLNFAGCIHLRGRKPEFRYPEFCVHDRGGITWGLLVDVACDVVGLRSPGGKGFGDFTTNINEVGPTYEFQQRGDPVQENLRLRREEEARINAKKARVEVDWVGGDNYRKDS